MTYVPKYQSTKTTVEPKSAHGFVWRLQMLSRRIAQATDNRSRVIYRITRSVTLLQAERLGHVRFVEICSKVGISSEPSVIEQHRRIAAKVNWLSKIAEHLPDSEEAISAVTDLLDSKIMGNLIYHRTINPRTSLAQLRMILRYSRAACAFDVIKQARAASL